MNFSKYHNQDITKSSFLITGGAGFIGSNLVEYLIQHHAGKIVILDNLSTGYLENIEEFIELPHVEFIPGDIRDYKTCFDALSGIDYVLHQAALGSVPRSVDDPITTNEVNISGFLNILTAAKENNVKRLVFAASSSTYGDSAELPKREEKIGNPLSPYAVTKYVNELYADVFSKVYGFHSIGLRYFNVFGPKQNLNGPYAAVIPLFINNYLEGKSSVINGDGITSRDFTFVANVVQANIKSLFLSDLAQYQVFNVACNEQTSLNELVTLIGNELGNTIPPTYAPERRGDVKHSLADISKAVKILDYQPEIKFGEGIKQTISFFQERFANNIN
ncbi:SDR family oxidoreductase [Dyadobacter sp. CY312]|uniref:SDR family oxidoreductase n=1 Tax=Dyadobacter sp. CY312 TaxID=2907303 RepID=UPI001F442972|nr:SDR family oxidoreductase [Dyadobacter sp. CY312]MCE7041270.1 SDR family oxidoreductase [Dyadobacter sp. CY312]